MNPKDKAQELVDKYRTYVVMWAGGIEVSNQNVKQCALIAVDEIIDIISSDESAIIVQLQYWQQVKTEIELL